MGLRIVTCSPVNRSSPEYGKHGCYNKTSIFFKSVMIVYFV